MQYYGHPRWEGVASWRGFNLRFTDGICPRCLERFREDHRAALERRHAEITRVRAPEQAA